MMIQSLGLKWVKTSPSTVVCLPSETGTGHLGQPDRRWLFPSKAVDVRTRWDASVPAGRVIVIVKGAMADDLNAVRAVQK